MRANEIKFLNELEKDGLVEIQEESILVTEIGQDFVQNIMNIFEVSELNLLAPSHLLTLLFCILVIVYVP